MKRRKKEFNWVLYESLHQIERGLLEVSRLVAASSLERQPAHPVSNPRRTAPSKRGGAGHGRGWQTSTGAAPPLPSALSPIPEDGSVVAPAEEPRETSLEAGPSKP